MSESVIKATAGIEHIQRWAGSNLLHCQVICIHCGRELSSFERRLLQLEGKAVGRHQFIVEVTRTVYTITTTFKGPCGRCLIFRKNA